MNLPPGWVMAPDGIAVRPLPLPAGGLIGLAEGRIPPGDYGIHFHYSLEQVTYVLVGRVRVVMDSPHEELELDPGQAVLTEPGRTLSFHNAGPGDAIVLFICAPPYPPDDSDTGRVADHGPLSEQERRTAAVRQRNVLSVVATLYTARAEKLGGWSALTPEADAEAERG